MSETTPAGANTTWTYDAASRPTSSVSPRGNAPGADPGAYMTLITRDEYGRPTDVRDPLSHPTTAYDANHNPIEVVDAAGRSTEVTYDAENRPTKVERAGQAQRTTYDANGRVVTRINAGDHIDHVSTGTRPDASLAWSILSGRETTFRATTCRARSVYRPAGRTTTYEYDDARRLIGVDHSEAATADVSFAYDVDGLAQQMPMARAPDVLL